MKPKIHIAEDGSGLLLFPPAPGPSLVLEVQNIQHFVSRPDWAPITALPVPITRTLEEWLSRWRLDELRISRDYGRQIEEIVVDLRFSNGLRIAFADPPAAMHSPTRIAEFEVVFTAQGLTHATIRRNGEPRGAISLALGPCDQNVARDRFSGFPNPRELALQVADAWEARWGTRPRPSQIANVGGRW